MKIRVRLFDKIGNKRKFAIEVKGNDSNIALNRIEKEIKLLYKED